MKFETLCAFLVGEPYYLSLEEIRKLTPYQLARVYGHERDDHGRPVLGPRPKPPTYEEGFRALWRARGLPEHLVEARWKLYRREEKTLAELQKKGLSALAA